MLKLATRYLKQGLALATCLTGIASCHSAPLPLPHRLPASPIRAFQAQGKTFQTPEWVRDAVFYQVFPERFHNGNKGNDPPNTQPWGSQPTVDNFMGGDLEGVTQKLPYLKELGINAIYFNPIFESPSNHKYNTSDFMKIDPHFGDMGTFRAMLTKAHQLGIKVILDGVLNHSGHTHWAFQDAVKQGPKSPHWNWYNIHGFPVIFEPKPNYDGWWGHYTLPKFNENNSEVRDYLYKITEFWTRQGIDGWRLDVPNEIKDHNFWRKYRALVKGINPEAYIVGEIWEDASPWLQGDQFDAVMNYVFRQTMHDFLLHDQLNVDQFDSQLETLRARHPAPATQTMFNLLGSHDTERLLTLAGGRVDKVKLAAFVQMTYLGAPVIYYGDEIGMEGGKDPDDRRAMQWSPSQQNRELKTYYQQLIQLRHQHPALRRGTFRSVRRHNLDRTFAYVREDGKNTLLMVLNNSDQAQHVEIDAAKTQLPDGTLQDLLSPKSYRIQNGRAMIQNVPPRTGLILRLTPAR